MANASNQSSERRQSISVPGGRNVWVALCIAGGVVLIGRFVTTGVLSGVFGLWGISLFVVTVVGWVAYRLWYHYGS